MIGIRIGSFSLVGWLAFSAAPMAAQPASNPTGALGQVVLFGEEEVKVQSATKTEIPLSKAPASVTVITAKQIRESGATTVADLLRLVAGVNVRTNVMVPTIDVRGFGENPFSNRLLLLIDGIPINSLETGGFPLSPVFDIFPVENIKRIEVVRGPGSALYGENAFWGVVSIVTLSGEDIAGGNVSFMGGDRRTLWGSAQFGQKVGEFSLLGSVRLLRSQLPTEFWLEEKSEFKANDVYVKASYKGLSASYYRHQEHMGGFSEDFSESGFPPGSVFESADVLKETLNIASLRYESPKGKAVSFSADFGYSARNGMHCAGCHASPEKAVFQEPADHGYQASGDLRLGIHAIPSHDILIGVDGRKLDPGDHVDELDPGAPVATGYQKGAVYIQDRWTLFDGKANLVGGLRYDAKSKVFDDYYSPRIALVVNPSSRLVLRAGWGTAFRFPGFSELYEDSWFLNVQNTALPIPPIPLAVFKPNPTLIPEEVQTYDFGTEVQIGSGFSAKLDLFRSRVKHFMVVAFETPPPDLATLQIVNHPDDATVLGGEFELRANIPNVATGFASYAYQEESQVGNGVDSTGKPFEFAYAPKHKINVGAYFGPFAGVRGTVEVEYRSQYVAPSFWYLVNSGFTDPTVRPLPSYTLVNARLSWELPIEVRGKRAVRLSAYGNNLLDVRPQQTLLGVPSRSVGREYFGRVEVSF